MAPVPSLPKPHYGADITTDGPSRDGRDGPRAVLAQAALWR